MSFELCEFLFSHFFLRGPENLFELGEFSNYGSSNLHEFNCIRHSKALELELLSAHIDSKSIGYDYISSMGDYFIPNSTS